MRTIRAVLTALRQGLSGRGFLLGVSGVLLAAVFSSVQEAAAALQGGGLLANGFHETLLAGALDADAMTLSLPICAALPCTAAFVDDIKSGFIKECLPRSGQAPYLAGRCAACALLGFLVFAVGIAAACTLFALVFTPMEAASEAGPLISASMEELLRRTLLFACSGALWSTVGALFAALTESRYMAYASPFVLYYVLVILYERYFDMLYVLYPKEWTSPSSRWVFGDAGVILFVAELTVLAALGFVLAAGRRLSQL